jgi:uncharacterized protein YodC (DUF2158 family)
VKLLYELGQRANSVFFWKDNDSGEEGTFRTTDEREAKRMINAMNEAYQQRMLHPEWTVGDLVQLKSGGSAMTITSFEKNGHVHCAWMRGNKVQKDHFPKNALKISQPKKCTRRTDRKPRRRARKPNLPDSTGTTSQVDSM